MEFKVVASNVKNLAATKRKVNENAKRLKLKPYVRLPRDLLSHPPIRHRHTDPSLHYLWTFEFGIMAAVIVVGSAQWHRQLHAKAFAYSGKQQRELHEEMEWKRAHRLAGIPTKPPFDGRRQTARQMFEDLGSRKYRQSHLRRMQKGAPTTVTVEVSATTLLTCVGLANAGSNHRRLEAALDRLLKPVADRPPVLLGWDPLADNRVRLEVDGLWLFANELFKKVPL
jgi:hypothetical protein